MYLLFLHENPALRSHLRSVCALAQMPNSRIISMIMLNCHELVSKPYLLGHDVLPKITEIGDTDIVVNELRQGIAKG